MPGEMLTHDTTGKVLPMGGEWALLDGNNGNGSLTNDVRQTFQTDDGAVIQIWETGQTQPDGSAFLRLAFETGSEKYCVLLDQLGRRHWTPLAVTDSSLTIDVWQVRRRGVWALAIDETETDSLKMTGPK